MNIVASNTNHLLRTNGGGSPVEYTAGPNINITNHVISGKYWDSEIAQAAADASAAAVNSAYDKTTAWVDSQNYLTAHQDVSNLPYVKNSSLGRTTQGQVSSISGDSLYAVSAQNSVNAQTANYANNAAHADSADNSTNATHSDLADSATFANSADQANIATNSVYSESANFVISGWEYGPNDKISGYNGTAFVGEGGIEYSGISPIVVNNDLRLISAESAQLGVMEPIYFVEDSLSSTIIGIRDSAFPTFQLTNDGRVSGINESAIYGADGGDYMAGANIGIVDNTISVTGTVPSATNSTYAYSSTLAENAGSAVRAEFATESNHSLSSDSATYDNLGRAITATYLTAHQALPDWGPEISAASGNAYNQSTAWVNSQHYLTGETEYSAGANINISNHIVSGKNWNDDITAAANSAFTAATAMIPTALTGDYVESTALNTGTYFDQIVLSGISGMPVFIRSADHARAADTANMSYISMTAHSLVGSASAWMDVTEYTAGPNISINHHIISGKNWTNDINAASSYAFNVATAMIPTALTGKYVSYSNITTGASGTTVYNVPSGIRVTASSGWAEIYSQNNENEREAHFAIGQNYDNGKSFYTELDGAGDGLFQMNWNSAHIAPNSHSGYTSATTARMFITNGALSYSSTDQSWTLDSGVFNDLYSTRNTVSDNSASWGGANAFATGAIQIYEDGWAGFTYNNMEFSYNYSKVMPSASDIGGTWMAKQLDNTNYLISFNMTGLGPWVTAQWDVKTDALVSRNAFVRRLGCIDLYKEWDSSVSYRIERKVNYPTGDEYVTFGDVQVYGAATGGDNNPWHMDAILEVEKTN